MIAASNDVDITWIEKYITFQQDHYNNLKQTDVHFLAEVIFNNAREFDAISATIHTDSRPTLATYRGSDKRAYTNGYFYTRKSRSFLDLDSLERTFPPSAEFTWQIEGPSGQSRLQPICIGGKDAKTCFPKESLIHLRQHGEAISRFNSLDANVALDIGWDPFTSGARLADSEWTDLVFVLVSNAAGEVLFTGGAPGAGGAFLDHTATSTVMPAGTLKPGSDYTIFISQVHYVDHNQSCGVTQLAANSFATELAVKTTGSAPETANPAPPRRAQYLWSRKTRGIELETWPTLADYW